MATSNRLGRDKYLLSLNCFSSSKSCWEVNAVRGRRDLDTYDKLPIQMQNSCKKRLKQSFHWNYSLEKLLEEMHSLVEIPIKKSFFLI